MVFFDLNLTGETGRGGSVPMNRKPVGGRTGAIARVMAVIAVLGAILGLFSRPPVTRFLEVMFYKPYSSNLAEKRGVRAKPLTVKIDRTSDFTQCGFKNGQRYFKAIHTDHLEFSGYTKNYIAQTVKPGGVPAKIKVVRDGKDYDTIPMKLPGYNGSEKEVQSVEVNGDSATIKYFQEYRAYEKDVDWGVGYTSSLPITEIKTSVILPPGKRVCRIWPENKDFSPQFKGGNCVISVGARPSITCKNLNIPPNEPHFIAWVWDVWESCESQKAVATEAAIGDQK